MNLRLKSLSLISALSVQDVRCRPPSYSIYTLERSLPEEGTLGPRVVSLASQNMSVTRRTLPEPKPVSTIITYKIYSNVNKADAYFPYGW